MLPTIVVAIGSVLLHGSPASHGAKTDTGGSWPALGALTAAALIYRVLIELPSASSVVDQKLGAYIGLLRARDRARRLRADARGARPSGPRGAGERRPAGAAGARSAPERAEPGVTFGSELRRNDTKERVEWTPRG